MVVSICGFCRPSGPIGLDRRASRGKRWRASRHPRRSRRAPRVCAHHLVRRQPRSGISPITSFAVNPGRGSPRCAGSRSCWTSSRRPRPGSEASAATAARPARWNGSPIAVAAALAFRLGPASAARCLAGSWRWRGRGVRGCHARDPDAGPRRSCGTSPRARRAWRAVAVVSSAIAAVALAFPARLGARRSVVRPRRRLGAAGARTEITRTARATSPSTAPVVPAILDT